MRVSVCLCDVLRGLEGLRNDPTVATRILIDLAGVHLLRPFSLSASPRGLRGVHEFRERCERDLENIRSVYRLNMRRAAAGSVVLHSLLFLFFYSFLSLTYGKFWF